MVRSTGAPVTRDPVWKAAETINSTHSVSTGSGQVRAGRRRRGRRRAHASLSPYSFACGSAEHHKAWRLGSRGDDVWPVVAVEIAGRHAVDRSRAVTEGDR